MKQNERNKYILQFVCYSPQIYSGLDKFFVLLTKKLIEEGVIPVFVYGETLDAVPNIRRDLETAGAIIETMPKIGYWAKIIAINKLYKRYKPILVDVHFDSLVKTYCLLLSQWYGTKHVTHIHSLIADMSIDDYIRQKGFVKRILLGINYALFNRYGKVVCVSQSIENQYKEWAYGDKRNVKTMYLGTDLTTSKLSKQQARETLRLPQEKVIITNISAIEHIKGIDLIIQAIAALKRKGIDVMFAHIGGLRADTPDNHDYAESLKHLVREEHVEDRVVWLGKRLDIHDIVSAFDIYVHPSRSEGLGCTLMEASVAEMPLVGSRVGGMPEVVIDGENGYLIDNENVEQLADVLHRLVGDYKLRKRMGEAAKERVFALFGLDKQTDMMKDVYKESVKISKTN